MFSGVLPSSHPGSSGRVADPTQSTKCAIQLISHLPLTNTPLYEIFERYLGSSKDRELYISPLLFDTKLNTSVAEQNGLRHAYTPLGNNRNRDDFLLVCVRYVA